MSRCLVNRRSTAVALAAAALAVIAAQVPASAQQKTTGPAADRLTSNSARPSGAMSTTQPAQPTVTRSVTGTAAAGTGPASSSVPSGLSANPNK